MQTGINRRRTLITIGFVAVIILILAYFVEWDEVITILRETNWLILLVGVFFLSIGIVFISVRWRYVLADKPTLKETFHADSIGYMITILSPIPGPALRIFALSQSTKVSISSATPAMVIDLLLTAVMRVVALILAITISLNLEQALTSILIGSVLIIVVLGFIIWLVRNPGKFLPWISRLLNRIPGMSGNRLEESLSDLQASLTALGSTKSISNALLLSIVMWGCFWLFNYLAFRAMPIELTTQEMLTLAAAALVVVPPSAPGMIGVYQGVLVGFLILFRITDSSTLAAYAVLVFAVQLILWLILGSWGLISTRLRLGDLISQSGEALNSESNSAEK